MLVDKEGHNIKLADRPNPHILVMGSSGYGKTFYCCRKMQEDEKRAFVLDYSGSFRETELRKNAVDCTQVKIFDPYEKPYYFLLSIKSDEKFIKDMTDAVVNLLGIHSYNQKTILMQMIDKNLMIRRSVNFGDLFQILKESWENEKAEEGGQERVENLERLLIRMEPLSDICHVYFKRCDNSAKVGTEKIRILQLSDFPEYQRHFLSELAITLLWKETMDDRVNGKFDMILLDEFQHLSMAKSGALYGILQEGRKYGLSLLLSTQFISRYSAEEQDALMQAGNCLFFKPTARELGHCADLIDGENRMEWKRILKGLQVGEIILNGSYRIEKRTRIHNQPVLCKII